MNVFGENPTQPQSMNELAQERQQSARLCDEVGRLKAENEKLVVRLAHANMDNEGARWLLERTKTKYPFDTGDCVQWTNRRDEWLTGNGNTNNELARIEEVLAWASENVTSADKWSCDGNWTVYDDKPLGIGVNVSPTLYEALKSAWENREKGEMSSEIENEFDRNVAELWANDRKELDRLRADKARLVGEVEKLQELHNMQLAGISTASIQNTESTVKDRINRDNPYWTVAYGDVCVAVDREMKHRNNLQRHKDALLAARVALEHCHALTIHGEVITRDECHLCKVLATINEVLGGDK